MDIDFGVEVVRSSSPKATSLPSKRPAARSRPQCTSARYDQLKVAHDAVHASRRREGRGFAGMSSEIYGDW